MNKAATIHYAILFVLIYFVVFLKLGSFHMRWWDESMFAVNTYEMLQNGKLFSLYFNGIPDLFNTKPPLTNWLQMISVKLFGYNEMALRLPSAVAACLSIAVLFKFMAKNFDYLWAWLTALVLMTSYGFIDFHTARTADSDALLTFFILVANLYFIQYIIDQSKKAKLLFFLFITLAFATKLYAALLFLPAYLFILLYKRLFKKFTWDRSFLLGISFFVLITGCLLYLRELEVPGYLNEIIFKDAGRMTSVIENHKESTFFYLNNFLDYRYSIWFVFAVLGIALTFFKSKSERKDILVASLSFLSSYLLIIMLSVTKLEWYDMPMYPYLAIFAAYPIYLALENIALNNEALTPLKKYLILSVIFIYPYVIMFDKAEAGRVRPAEMELEANENFLFKKIKNNESMDNVKVLHNSWNGSLLFYKYKLAEMDQNIELLTNVNSVSVNDRVLVCTDDLKERLSIFFKITLLDQVNNSELFLVEKRRLTSTKK